VLDTIGGPAFAACVAALRPGGALCSSARSPGGDVALDAWRLLAPLTLTGWSSESLDGPVAARGDRQARGLAADRRASGTPEHRTSPCATPPRRIASRAGRRARAPSCCSPIVLVRRREWRPRNPGASLGRFSSFRGDAAMPSLLEVLGLKTLPALVDQGTEGDTAGDDGEVAVAPPVVGTGSAPHARLG
jgi:hypothetical protein